MCTDASFWSFGLVCKDFDEKLVGSAGGFSERWRGDVQVQSRAWAGITTGPPEGNSKTPCRGFSGPPEGNSKTPCGGSQGRRMEIRRPLGGLRGLPAQRRRGGGQSGSPPAGR
eukprot:3686892-Pyramimonas_sp.AAC.1